jgi:hypothetical protein
MFKFKENDFGKDIKKCRFEALYLSHEFIAQSQANIHLYYFNFQDRTGSARHACID